MKKMLFLIFSLITIHQGFSQNDQFSNQTGLSGLPIFDVLNLFPDNEISGGTINLNYGRYISKNISFGINLYAANASNKYPTNTLDFHSEKENISLQGLNSNLRYNRFLSNKVSAYGVISFGFGNYKSETINLSNNSEITLANEPISILMTGLGINYFVTKQMALEFSLPYVFMNRFSSKPYVENFHGIAPMIGIQYYW